MVETSLKRCLRLKKKKALKSALFSTYPKKNTSFIKPKSKTLEASL